MSKVILITGASSGLGRSCAEHLAELGHHVYGTSRRGAWPAENYSGPWPITIPMEVGDEDSVCRAVDFIVAREGRLDVVVNNAGIGIAGSIEDVSPQEAQALFETNFFGVHRVCRAVLPTLREQRDGLIVNVSSLGGRLTIPFQGFYSASKYAVEALTEALRMEVGVFGVRVTMIEPGDCKTGFTDARVFAAQSAVGSPYEERCSRAVAVMEDDERNGADAADVARLLARVIETDAPRVRYPVGMFVQRVAVAISRFLPAGLIEKALKTNYKI